MHRGLLPITLRCSLGARDAEPDRSGRIEGGGRPRSRRPQSIRQGNHSTGFPGARSMSRESYRPAKVFTLEQANACLPLVRSITGDMVALARDMLDRRQRLDQLAAGRDTSRVDLYSEELMQIEEELEKDTQR